MERQELMNRIEKFCDFALEHQSDDGQLDLEEAHFRYPTGINMRTLAATHKITAKKACLAGVLKWTDLIFPQQKKNGNWNDEPFENNAAKSAGVQELFPLEMLLSLPEADSPFPGMVGWIHQDEQTPVVFWHTAEGCVCKPHSHPYPEWGIVVSGDAQVTVDGQALTYRAGDCFSIPANTVYGSRISKDYRAIDLFASPNHVKPNHNRHGGAN